MIESDEEEFEVPPAEEDGADTLEEEEDEILEVDFKSTDAEEDNE